MYIPIKKRKQRGGVFRGVNRQRSKKKQDGGLYFIRNTPKRWRRRRHQKGGIFRGTNRQRSISQDGGIFRGTNRQRSIKNQDGGSYGQKPRLGRHENVTTVYHP